MHAANGGGPSRLPSARLMAAVAELGLGDFRIMALNCFHFAIGDGRGHVRRICAALFVVGLFAASWFVSGTQVTRALAAFVPVAVLMFAVELTAEARQKLSLR